MRHHRDSPLGGGQCVSEPSQGPCSSLTNPQYSNGGGQRFCPHFVRTFVSFLSTVSCFCRIFHENLKFGMLSVIKVMFRRVSSEVRV